MVFGHNFVKFTHIKTNAEIVFNAKESLHEWAINCNDQKVDVAYSQGWTEKRQGMVCKKNIIVIDNELKKMK